MLGSGRVRPARRARSSAPAARVANRRRGRRRARPRPDAAGTLAWRTGPLARRPTAFASGCIASRHSGSWGDDDRSTSSAARLINSNQRDDPRSCKPLRSPSRRPADRGARPTRRGRAETSALDTEPSRTTQTTNPMREDDEEEPRPRRGTRRCRTAGSPRTRALEQMNVYDWIETQIQDNHSSSLRTSSSNITLNKEYSDVTIDQSSLDRSSTCSAYQLSPKGFAIFGVSDRP